MNPELMLLDTLDPAVKREILRLPSEQRTVAIQSLKDQLTNQIRKSLLDPALLLRTGVLANDTTPLSFPHQLLVEVLKANGILSTDFLRTHFTEELAVGIAMKLCSCGRGAPPPGAYSSHEPTTNVDVEFRTSVIDRKPPRPLRARPIAPRSLYPTIGWTGLTLFTWHPGRQFQATVTGAGRMTGISCTCVDPTGSFGGLYLGFSVSHKDWKRLESGGVRVAVYDPYLRVDAGGQRTLRIDSPGDFAILSETTELEDDKKVPHYKCLGDSALQEGASRAEGNEPAAKALEHYVAALRETHDGKLGLACLNNLAQCLIKQTHYSEALVCAAGALLFDPESTKANGRYDLAANGLRKAASGEHDLFSLFLRSRVSEEHSNNAVLSAIPSVAATVLRTAATNNWNVSSESSAANCREEGNKEFAEGNFGQAAWYYLQGLYRLPLLGKVISNAALAYMQLRMWPQSFACANLCTIFFAETDCALYVKSVQRMAVALSHLGYHETSVALLDQLEDGGNEGKVVAETRSVVETVRQERNGVFDVDRYWEQDSEPLAEYFGPLQIRDTRTTKGRGLFLTRDVKAGTVLLCSHALTFGADAYALSTIVNQPPGGMGLATISYGPTVLRGETLIQVKRLQALTSIEGCGTLNKQLRELCGASCTPGVGNEEGTSTKLLENVDPNFLRKAFQTSPFLVEPFPEHGGFDISRTAEAVIQNSFGSHRSVFGVLLSSDLPTATPGESHLYHLSSFMNHSDDPNTIYRVLGRSMLVVAGTDLPKGAELTTTYTPPLLMVDPEKVVQVRKNWHLPPIPQEIVQRASRFTKEIELAVDRKDASFLVERCSLPPFLTAEGLAEAGVPTVLSHQAQFFLDASRYLLTKSPRYLRAALEIGLKTPSCWKLSVAWPILLGTRLGRNINVVATHREDSGSGDERECELMFTTATRRYFGTSNLRTLSRMLDTHLRAAYQHQGNPSQTEFFTTFRSW